MLRKRRVKVIAKRRGDLLGISHDDKRTLELKATTVREVKDVIRTRELILWGVACSSDLHNEHVDERGIDDEAV